MRVLVTKLDPAALTNADGTEQRPPLTVSILLADTIKNVFSDESVSAIFAGENQLF